VNRGEPWRGLPTIGRVPVSRGRKPKSKSKSKAKKRAPRGPSVADVIPPGLVVDPGLSPLQGLFLGGRERPDWFSRSIKAVLDRAGVLMQAQGPRELEQATAELFGAELQSVVRDERRGLWFDWLAEELTEAAADRILDEAARGDDSWQVQWRLLYGLSSIGSPGLQAVAERALRRVRTELTADARAQQPKWLQLLPKIAATGDVWEMHDVYGTRFGVIAGFQYPGGTDRSVFLFDIDACEIVRLAGAGVFDDVAQAATAWRELVGEAAADAEPSPVESPARLYCLVHLELEEALLDGSEPRSVLDNWFRANRRHMDLADALRRRGMPLPTAKSLYHDLDTAPMEKAFRGWYLRRHGSEPDAEVVEALAEEWLEGAIPGTTHSASPHRVQSQLNLISDWIPDHPVTVGAKALLPEWVRWNCEQSRLPGQLIERSVAVATGEQTASLDISP
jgi:hypothetical protein